MTELIQIDQVLLLQKRCCTIRKKEAIKETFWLYDKKII